MSIGRYDALDSLLLKGDGNGEFLPLSIRQNGIYIPGDGKALVKLSGSTGSYLVAEKKEFYHGSSFLSQSARTIMVNDNVSGITLFDNKGKKRELQF